MQCIETSGETTLLGKVEMTTFIKHLHYKHEFKPCTVLKHSVAGACFHLLHLIVFIIIFMKTFFAENICLWKSSLFESHVYSRTAHTVSIAQ